MRALLVVLLFVLGTIVPVLGTPAQAAPLYRAEAEGVVIALTDEPCAMKEVTNLPRRATWTERGGGGGRGLLGRLAAAAGALLLRG